MKIIFKFFPQCTFQLYLFIMEPIQIIKVKPFYWQYKKPMKLINFKKINIKSKLNIKTIIRMYKYEQKCFLKAHKMIFKNMAVNL